MAEEAKVIQRHIRLFYQPVPKDSGACERGILNPNADSGRGV